LRREREENCRSTSGEPRHQFASHRFHPDESSFGRLEARLRWDSN
jgi:hypothetical protein